MKTVLGQLARRRGLPILVLGTLFAAPAAAHDLWIEADSAGYRVLYGHRASGHEGPARIETAPGFVRAVACLDPTGRLVHPALTDSAPARFAGRFSAIHVDASSGYWTRTPLGLQNQAMDEVDHPLGGWLSHESAKRIDAWSDRLREPMTGSLEVVPLEDPFSLGPGGKLPLLVTLEGKPVEGAIVSYDGKPRGATGADGRINIRLRREGLQVIAASLTTEIESARAERIVRVAFLEFDLEASR